jgi:uncharacterized membrane protein
MKNKVQDILLFPFCCNRNHFFIVRIGGKPRRLCTRSVPMLFGALSMMGLVAGSGLAKSDGNVLALTGLLLILPDLIYWALTRKKLVQDYIPVRVATGFLLGVGIVVFGQASIALSIKVGLPLIFFVMMIVADKQLKLPPAA